MTQFEKGKRDMQKHLTIATLSAKRRAALTPEQEQQTRAHLAQCRECTQLEETLKKIDAITLPQKAQTAQQTTACLEVETLANYFNRQYSFYRRWQIHRHIAACADCRGALTDLLRIANTELSEVEHAWLKTLPAFQPEARASREHSPPYALESKDPVRQSFWSGVKTIFRTRPLPAYGLVFAVTLFLAIKIGLPEFSDWQSRRLAQEGLNELARDHEISSGQLRPAGKFQPELLSAGTRSSQPSSQQNTASAKFQNSLRWNANNLSARRGQALAAFFAQDTASAHHLLHELHLQYTESAEIANDLGVVTAALGASEKALYYFEHALARNPDFPEACFNRAHLLQRLNRRAEARQAWQKYLELNEGTDWRQAARLQNSRLE